MTPAEHSAFIFDLDGTLIDSAAQIMRCLREAFARAGREADPSLFTPRRVGPPVRQIIADIDPSLQGAPQTEEIVAHFRALYDHSADDPSGLYPHVRAFLDKLHAAHKPLFVATFKPKTPVFRLLESLRLSPYFKDVYTVDKYDKSLTKAQMVRELVSQYRLHPQTSLLLGDTLSDLNAARAAGVRGAACLWGYGQNKEELARAADYVFTSPEELLK